jgi:hypothetical protein
MSPKPTRRLKRLLLGGVVVASLGCMAVVNGRLFHRPTAAQPRQGFVCRSAHFTLTAEIHAGS